MTCKYWTGIGSRSVSKEEADVQRSIGKHMAEKGYTLLSGGANGSDTHFHEGVCEVDPSLAVIYMPWEGFNIKSRPENSLEETFRTINFKQFKDARDYMMRGIIPHFLNMSKTSQSFHSRNYYQIMHDPNNLPVVCIYCSYLEGVKVKGGTRTAVELAKEKGITTLNMRVPNQLTKIYNFIISLPEVR